MKIGHRVAAGFALLVTLLIAALIYHGTLVQTLLDTNLDLSARRLQAAQVALRLAPLLDEQQKLIRKAMITADPAYEAKIEANNQVVGLHVVRLASLVAGPDELLAIQRLAKTWSQEQGLQLPVPATTTTDLPPIVDDDQLEAAALNYRRLRDQTENILETTLVAIDQQSARSASKVGWAAHFDRTVIGAALAVSLVVGFLTVHSINRPLGGLIAATRQVANGDFVLRLDTSRGDELGQVAAAFNTMTGRLAALDRIKKDFVARVSHDLRTPLVAIQETNDVLLDGLAGDLDAQQRRLVRLNRDSARRLAGRITNLLDLSRIEVGGLELDIKAHDFKALVRLAIDELEGRVRNRGLRLGSQLPTEPVALRCDGDRIAQVVENLLDNAIKFSSSAGQVDVDLRTVARLPEHLPVSQRPRTTQPASWGFLTVADRGPGVADQDKERIFRSFFRALPRAGHEDVPGGTGLGLAICRDIIDAHDGAVWVTDHAGGGSRFHVLLPLHEASA